jgi:hypothetical protein
VKQDENINRPVRSSDFFVIISGFFLNLIATLETLADDLHQLAVYHSTQKSQEARVWSEFTQNLETLKED